MVSWHDTIKHLYLKEEHGETTYVQLRVSSMLTAVENMCLIWHHCALLSGI